MKKYWIENTFSVLFVVVMLIAVAGCATVNEDEREWRQGIDAENWSLCELVYRQNGKATVHNNHDYSHKHISPIDLKMDLGFNNCKRILGDYWASY